MKQPGRTVVIRTQGTTRRLEAAATVGRRSGRAARAEMFAPPGSKGAPKPNTSALVVLIHRTTGPARARGHGLGSQPAPRGRRTAAATSAAIRCGHPVIFHVVDSLSGTSSGGLGRVAVAAEPIGSSATLLLHAAVSQMPHCPILARGGPRG